MEPNGTQARPSEDESRIAMLLQENAQLKTLIHKMVDTSSALIFSNMTLRGIARQALRKTREMPLEERQKYGWMDWVEETVVSLKAGVERTREAYDALVKSRNALEKGVSEKEVSSSPLGGEADLA